MAKVTVAEVQAPNGWWSIPGSGYDVLEYAIYPYEDFEFCLSVAVESRDARRKVAYKRDTKRVR